MTEWWRKVSGWLRREVIDAELQEEIRTHLEMKASSTGDPRSAHRQFGNTTLLLEDSRAAWGWPRLEGWLRDFRYGLRVMIRRPGFAGTVVLTLALGIGASSTIFSLIDAVLIRPLAYPNSERLVVVHEMRLSAERTRSRVAPGRLEDWQRLTRGFEALAGSYQDTVTEATGTAPERVSSAIVSPRFFSVLGSNPALGRVFNSEEEGFGGSAAIVISDGLWRRRFSADPAVLGRSLVLAGQSFRIVGVMPRTFQYPSPSTDVWAPKQARPGLMQVREARFYDCIGRLKQGVTLEQAQADLEAVQRTLGEQYPKTDSGWSVELEPLKDRLVGKIRLALWLLLGSVSLLLVIACSNVACLLLAQLNSRAGEIATRCALGASRGAISRQLLAEGLAYALVGGCLGMTVAFVGAILLQRQLSDIPRITELTVDARVLAFVVAVSVIAAILFSLAPVFQTFRRDLAGSLIQAGRGVISGGQRLPRILVSAQLALAMVLLIAAGLFLRSLLRLQEAPLGFRPDNVLTLRISASFSERAEAAVERHRRTLDVLSSLPGVGAVGMSAGLPATISLVPIESRIAGEPTDRGGGKQFAGQRVVTAGYFQTLGIPILAGQTCRMNPDPQKPFQALVNQKFVDRFFPGRDPIGRTVIQGPQENARTMEIVGVVRDVREEGYARESEPMTYACGFLRYWPDSDFLIQIRDHSATMTSAVREAIQAIEPARAVYSVRPLTDVLSGTLSQNRFRALLVSLFSVMALTLAAIGLYGVMAYMVTQRTREIGIRVALGARPSQIVGEVLRSGGVLAGAGAAAGIALAAVTSRLVATLLYGIRPTDVTTYLSATGVLVGVALLACLIPGRRATSIDPTEALREQ